MNVYVGATVVMSAIAVLAGVGAVIAWFYKRGGTEREMTLALKQNTEATHELSGHFHSFRENVVAEQHSQDIRLTRVEAILDDSTPADRNSRPAGRH